MLGFGVASRYGHTIPQAKNAFEDSWLSLYFINVGRLWARNDVEDRKASVGLLNHVVWLLFLKQLVILSSYISFHIVPRLCTINVYSISYSIKIYLCW